MRLSQSAHPQTARVGQTIRLEIRAMKVTTQIRQFQLSHQMRTQVLLDILQMCLATRAQQILLRALVTRRILSTVHML